MNEVMMMAGVEDGYPDIDYNDEEECPHGVPFDEICEECDEECPDCGEMLDECVCNIDDGGN